MLSKYKQMWLFTMFDLPVGTNSERKKASGFRNALLKDGYSMFQFSVYVRHCGSPQLAHLHERRLRLMVPDKGLVTVLSITDQQFGNMQNYFGKFDRRPSQRALPQLEFFL